MRFDGTVRASIPTVRRYLMENYRHKDGSPLAFDDASHLILRHEAVVMDSIQKLSYAYYPGDAIARAESLEYIEEDEDES